MSLLEIEKRILTEAETEALKIKRESDKNIKSMDVLNKQKIEELKTQTLKEARQRAKETKTKILVPARLKMNKSILAEKQKIIGQLYNEVKKEKNLSSVEINRIREESEILAAQILFGD